MSAKLLNLIREEEDRAEQIKRDAITESKRIIDAATGEAAAEIEKARSEAHSLYKEALIKANSDALHEYEKMIHHAHWECGMLISNAEKKLEKAVELVVRKVVN